MITRRIILTAPFLPLPAVASPDRVATLVAAFSAGTPIRNGRVKLDLPVLVDNGNAVSMSVSVDGSAREIAVFADANPLPEVLRVRFGPASDPARFDTRIRLATSQTVTAVARLDDGTCWRDRVELLVTIAACIE